MEIKKIIFYLSNGETAEIKGEGVQEFFEQLNRLQSDSLITLPNGIINMRHVVSVGYVTD